jgi:hypothetical protein
MSRRAAFPASSLHFGAPISSISGESSLSYGCRGGNPRLRLDKRCRKYIEDVGMDLQPMMDSSFTSQRVQRSYPDQVIETKLEDLIAVQSPDRSKKQESEYSTSSFPEHLAETDRRPVMLVYVSSIVVYLPIFTRLCCLGSHLHSLQKRIAPRGLCHQNAKLQGQSNARFNLEFRPNGGGPRRPRVDAQDRAAELSLEDRLSKPRRVTAPFARSAYNLQDQPVYDMATLSFVQGYYKREEDARQKDRFSRKL